HRRGERSPRSLSLAQVSEPSASPRGEALRGNRMPDKPSYLGLLNAVSCAETRAHQYLTAWADVTKDPEVRAVLLKVAAREGEHGMSFAKRINELGFELQVTEDPHFEEQMAIACSTECSDLE